MAIFNLFSKRQKKLRGEIPDVFNYDIIPKELRIQVIQIIQDCIGTDRYHEIYSRDIYSKIHGALCREYGIFTLKKKREDDNETAVLTFLLETPDFERAIDVIELSFKAIDKGIREDYDTYSYFTGSSITPDDAIEELNFRFKEHAIGYQFESGEMIRIDSTYIHSEIVKPTIALLKNSKFKGANEEYLKAHEHYRNGRNKECLSECLKAFESTLKVICKQKKWKFVETDTSKKLIQICFQNNLIPSFTQNQFSSLQNILESGIPTIRNRLSGHGQGAVPQKVDDDMTRYALNLTGTNIIFLVGQSGIK